MSALTLAEAKAFLDISDATHDSKIQNTIDEAESLIGQKVGPLTPTVVTTRVYLNGCYLTLPVTPVISLTSVIPLAGTATDVSLLYVNSGSGIVSWNSTLPGYWGGLTGNTYDVVYVAGYATVPAGLKSAIKQMVRHLWRPQRGPQGRTPEGEAAPRYLFPNEVLQAIEPYLQNFGFS